MEEELEQRIRKAKRANSREWMHFVVVAFLWIMIILLKGDYTPVVTLEYIAFVVLMTTTTYVFVNSQFLSKDYEINLEKTT